MRRPIRTWVLAGLAAGLAGTVGPVPAAQADPAFGGYSTEAVATPLKIEIYEPTIPIPATPQAELEFAYTKVEAASGPTGQGLASWLWPGDPIGQGCKTFIEQLKLGDTGLCKDGYPVQVNSQSPGEPSKESDEPVPGSMMRTSSDPKRVSSTVAWSSNCDVSENGGEKPELPGAPAPEPPDSPLGDLGAAITGKDRAAADEQPSGPCPPQELAGLVDVDGMVSDSYTETSGTSVTAVATSKLSNISLIGGLITADSITVTTKTSADGTRPTASGVSRVTGLELAGQPITVGRDGVQLVDQKQKLPDMPQDPEKALAQLGVSLVLPKPERSARGDSGSAAFQGLQIVVDTRPLRSNLDDIPFDDITKQIPEENTRSLVGAATQLAPKFVITAGNASAETQTVPALAFDLPSVDAGQLNGAASTPTSGAGGTSSGAAAGSAGAAPALEGQAAAGGPPGDAEALSVNPASAGLPPLASIPGALFAGGIVMAAGIGWWLQKIGGLVLGGAGACSHGLETGVPDLRKA